jgi:hypothetical protein
LETGEVYTGFWWGNLIVRDPLKYLEVVMRITLISWYDVTQ